MGNIKFYMRPAFDKDNRLKMVINEALVTKEGIVIDNNVIYEDKHKISYPFTFQKSKRKVCDYGGSSIKN